jgi:hypothetical protein
MKRLYNNTDAVKQLVQDILSGKFTTDGDDSDD